MYCINSIYFIDLKVVLYQLIKIENELRKQSASHSYLQSGETQQVDIVIDSIYFSSPYLEKFYSDQKLKEMVVTSLRNFYFENIKVKSVTIQFPTRNLVITVNKSI